MTSTPTRSRTRVSGVIIGFVVAILLTVMCVYGEAFSWAASRGVLLDIKLQTVAFPAPAPSWTFTLATGLLCATCAIWLLQRRVTSFQMARAWSALIVSAGLMLAAVVVRATSPRGWSIDILTGWQKSAHFLTDSSAYIVFVGILTFSVLYKLVLTPEDLLPHQRDDGTLEGADD